MLSLCDTIVLFAFAMLVGIAVLSLVHRSEFGAVDLLLAPATGYALLVVIAVPLSRAGFPVALFALPLAIALSALSAYVIILQRAAIRGAMVLSWPFVLILVGAFVLSAAPMIKYDSNWFAYSNQDAVNYAMSAERLRDHGLYTRPDSSEFVADRDIDEQMYLLNGASRERFGADELLAFEVSIMRRDALRLIMPSLVALHLAGILSLAALVYRGALGRAQAITAGVALSVSALATSGVVHQLLAQLSGLMLLSALLAMACAPKFGGDKAARIRHALLVALLAAALCESYPELFPYAVLTVAGYYAFCRRDMALSRARYLALSLVVCLLTLNGYVLNVLYVLADRFVGRAGFNDVFPYFLVPSGLSDLFGLTAMGVAAPEPWLSISIACGLALMMATVAASLYAIRRQEPAGILMALYLISLGALFVRRSGFSLFKLSMFVQPAIASVVAIVIVGVVANGWRRRWTVPVTACALGLLIANVLVQITYVTASKGSDDLKAANYIEVWDISGGHAFDRLAALRRLLSPGDTVVSDANNPALARIEAFYARGSAGVSFPAGDEQQARWLLPSSRHAFLDLPRYTIGHELSLERARRYSWRVFPVGHVGAQFLLDRYDNPRSTLWLHGSDSSSFNRASLGFADFVSTVPRPVNVLAFVSSSMGFASYEHEGRVGLFPLEPDVVFPGSTMTAVGRYLLFEVLNPRGPMRIKVALTNTFRGDGEAKIPPLSVIGTARVAFPVTGRGSAEVTSGLVEPRVIDGHSYIMLDLGIRPSPFVTHRSGLMLLWGRDIPLDRRSITAFVRDVSAVGPRGQDSSPARISVFPDDLRRGHVEYSGIYEDGWASEDITLSLKVGDDGVAHLHGSVPDVGDPDFQSEVTCFVDGFRESSSRVAVGYNDIAVMAGRGVHRIEWRFSRYQRLPGDDRRPVSLLIKSVD